MDGEDARTGSRAPELEVAEDHHSGGLPTLVLWSDRARVWRYSVPRLDPDLVRHRRPVRHPPRYTQMDRTSSVTWRVTSTAEQGAALRPASPVETSSIVLRCEQLVIMGERETARFKETLSMQRCAPPCRSWHGHASPVATRSDGRDADRSRTRRPIGR